MENIDNIISAKLRELLFFLHQACQEFETVAKQAKDENIGMTIKELIMETNQYEQELNSQLQSLQIKDLDGLDNEHEKALKNFHVAVKDLPDKKIMDICCKTEKNFEKAYRSVLNEFFPYPNLRNMLVYQLNGIKCAFMKMKLLNSVLWR